MVGVTSYNFPLSAQIALLGLFFVSEKFAILTVFQHSPNVRFISKADVNSLKAKVFFRIRGDLFGADLGC
jgi:hypothetical protein